MRRYKMTIISLIGRSGCGKGTQIDFLKKDTGFEVIKTGSLLRQKASEDDFLGKKIGEFLSQGRIMPTPVVFSLWMPKLIEIRNSSSPSGVIFDGNPRKLYEAKMLEEVFEMFGWQGSFFPIHLKISREEAERRLLERGREDDNSEEIKNRLDWFETEVVPVLQFYKEKGYLIEVNGEQSIEEVYKDIKKVLKLDD